MKKLHILSLLLVISSLYGCSCIQSSIHFTQGTRCLEEGNFQEARIHLEKACELEPRLSRYHNNLAHAYLHLGEIDKAWYQARQAAFLDPGNYEAVTTFKSLLNQLIQSHNIKHGSSKEEVENAFGEPDDFLEGSNDVIQYGLCILLFKEGKLVGKSMILGGSDALGIPSFESF